MFYFFLSFVGALVVLGEIIKIMKIEFYRTMTYDDVFSATKTVHPNYGENVENHKLMK